MRERRVLLIAAAALLLAAAGTGLLRAATGAAPKGYVLAEITVTDPDAYKQYAAAVAPMIAKFGGRYLVRGGQTLPLEGDPPAGRIVVIEFESLDAARTFETSSEYQGIAPLRHKAARSRVFLAEGTAP
jgi:uncharacterized protein (DUF1330 family)